MAYISEVKSGEHTLYCIKLEDLTLRSSNKGKAIKVVSAINKVGYRKYSDIPFQYRKELTSFFI